MPKYYVLLNWTESLEAKDEDEVRQLAAERFASWLEFQHLDDIAKMMIPTEVKDVKP